MKKVTYYVVTDNSTDYDNMRCYTVCQSKKECDEFINKYLIVMNSEHYIEWCNLRKLSHKDIASWNTYKKMLELDKKFITLKVKNTLNNVLSIMRKASNCPIIGCSYETEIERSR